MWPGPVEPLRLTNELDRIKDFFEPLDTWIIPTTLLELPSRRVDLSHLITS